MKKEIGTSTLEVVKITQTILHKRNQTLLQKLMKKSELRKRKREKEGYVLKKMAASGFIVVKVGNTFGVEMVIQRLFMMNGRVKF